MRTEIVALTLLTTALVGCGGPPKPDWVPVTLTPAEVAEAECRQSPEVVEVRVARALGRSGGPFSKSHEMDACMALKGFKRN